MKQKILLIFAFAGALVMQSCHKDPYFTYGYIRTEEVQKKLCDGISGSYTGRLIILMQDTAMHATKNEDGNWTRKSVREEIKAFQYTIGGYGNQNVFLQQFPIGWLGRVVSDKALAAALSKVEPRDIVASYAIHGYESLQDHTGEIRYTFAPVSLTLDYGGTTHLVTIHIKADMTYLIDADNPSSWSHLGMQFEVEQIDVDGKKNEFFTDGWDNSPEFFCVIRTK